MSAQSFESPERDIANLLSDSAIAPLKSELERVGNSENPSSGSDLSAIALVAGQKYDIELDYYENGGNASLELLWV